MTDDPIVLAHEPRLQTLTRFDETVTRTPAIRREVLAGGRIKGGMIAAHVRWVNDQRRPEEAARFLDALAPDVRDRVRVLLPINWYEFSDLIAVDRVIVSMFGAGMSGVLRELGGYSARLNLGGVYKTFTRTSVHEFLENGAKLHANFQDFGSAKYVQVGATAGKMVHSDYPSYSPLYCESALGYYREAVALHGVTNSSAVETECQCRGDKSCTFVLRWR